MYLPRYQIICPLALIMLKPKDTKVCVVTFQRDTSNAQMNNIFIVFM